MNWEAEAKALWIAATNALHKLEQSRFSNAEHEQAKDILRKATTAPQRHTQRQVSPRQGDDAGNTIEAIRGQDSDKHICD